jgi:hypothetical protein
MNTRASVLSALALVLLVSTTATAAHLSGAPGSPEATTAIEGNQLPPPSQKFEGEIERNVVQSKPYWPARVVPPRDAPNILLIMTDDTGFGVSSTFGGVVPTPGAVHAPHHPTPIAAGQAHFLSRAAIE